MGSSHDPDFQERLRLLPASRRVLAIGVVKVASVLAGMIFVGVLIDQVLSLRPLLNDPWRWSGLGPLIVGILLEAEATMVFWVHGQGTPNPAAAPSSVVDRGPYAHSRNPLYLARLLLLVGVACIVGSPSLLAIAFLLFLGLEFYLIPREESRLRTRFGQAYDAYCGRVHRWINVRGGQKAGKGP